MRCPSYYLLAKSSLATPSARMSPLGQPVVPAPPLPQRRVENRGPVLRLVVLVPAGLVPDQWLAFRTLLHAPCTLHIAEVSDARVRKEHRRAHLLGTLTTPARSIAKWSEQALHVVVPALVVRVHAPMPSRTKRQQID
eukprot:CAMPEP_0179015206 /NCGR_PEP_ID=MMETSP0796-20121207/2668_1 /TAXON_ID=73915 /ORGANISM="Pyrodinium bahamense, Strain pbaha01" /LENGTH=137 /DNA_ID=CAMNT_0020710825 /DNA_START=131 /DNA_END=544 /DNA_ORIENTATION=+